jgi:hypothetical protein
VLVFCCTVSDVIVENVQPQSMEVFEHGRMLSWCFMEDLRACCACACVAGEVQPKSMEVSGYPAC